ncbi:MAG: sugar ABC transporter substrate-binding protein [Actinomycetota bacterium]|nr:sugar ABC transporter substrate-binding protein [Actinomycetota bacterium]
MPSGHRGIRLRRIPAAFGAVLSAVALTGLAAAPTGASAPPRHQGRTLHVAYLSFAVQNSYDAPMLRAARQEAKKANVDLTVFDAENSPTKQYAELQDAITSHKYQGIIVQPIFGTGLLGLVRQAIAAHIAVANMDQELGPDLATDKPQVKGLAVNVVFVPTEIGTKLGQLVVKACSKYNPCNVGYMYDIKASALDEALHGAFMKVVSSHTNVKIVTEGQSYFTPSDGLTAAQNMLTAHPNLTLIVGSDQGIEGAQQAVAAAGKTGKVILVGYGASAAALKGIRSGAWYGDVAQLPASEGRLAVEYLAESIRTGKHFGGIDPVAELPHGGIVTKADVGEFHAEWPG